MQFCARCGTQLVAGVRSCSACGHPVAAAAPSAPGPTAMPAFSGPPTSAATGTEGLSSASTPIGMRGTTTPLPTAPATTGWQKAEKVADAVGSGFRIVARILVSLLWIGVTVAGFASGAWPIGLVGIMYLVYLWVLRGRWLIY